MVRCYLLATNSRFDRYWIATSIVNGFGGGFRGERRGKMDLASKPLRVHPTVQGSRAWNRGADLPLNVGGDPTAIRLLLSGVPLPSPGGR
jgi:hypothetical protein